MSNLRENSTAPATIFVSTVVEKDGKILMIQEGKDNYHQHGKWNFPAGHAELGENLTEAAIRETKEESGYDVKIDGILSIRKKDFTDEMSVILFFKGSVVRENSAHEDNIMNVKFVPIDEIRELDLRFSDLVEIADLAKSGKTYSLDILAEGSDEK